MSSTLRELEWDVALPEISDKLPVAVLATPSYEERLHAVRTLHDRFALGDTVEVDLSYGVAHASDRGDVRYFAASGAVRAHDAVVCRTPPYHCREWTDVAGDGAGFTPGDRLGGTLLADAGELLRVARLLADGLDGVDVVLDRWSRLDEAGREIERGPGRAVVRARYSLDGFPFIGAGAKTRLTYDLVDGRPALARVLHVHRPVTDVHLVSSGGAEHALAGLLRDPFLAEQREHGARTVVTGVRVGLLALPAVVSQRIAVPAVAVRGTVGDGVPFARYYQAVSAAALRRVGLAAAHVRH